MYSPKLFGDGFAVPQGFLRRECLIEPLSIRHVTIDFAAVMASRNQLFSQYGKDSGWPLNTTFLDNLADLGWHEKEFRDEASFAYTVINPEKDVCYGCIYVIPHEGAQLMTFWIRSDGVAPFTPAEFFDLLQAWVWDEWPNTVRLEKPDPAIWGA